jgi:hypothetical protein
MQQRLVTFQNPTGSVNNSDLELAGSLFSQEAASQCFDVRERTIKDSTDNMATMFWSRKGSVTTTGPPAKLLRIAAIHQRFHRYVALKDFLAGHRNRMADDASRLNHLSNIEFLTYFNSTYPQRPSWALWTPTQPFCSAVTSALRKQTSPLASFLLEPTLPRDIGEPGAHSAPPLDWILPYKSAKIPSLSSKFLCDDTDTASSPPVASRSALAPWKMPYGVLAKRLPQWGPRTLV